MSIVEIQQKRQATAPRSQAILSGLHVYNIDLHYHAGQERQPGTTLESYFEHALMTGRVIVGMTDHLERYIGNPLNPSDQPLYEQSAKGFQDYRADVDRVKKNYPMLRILFGPEIHAGPRIDIRRTPQEIVDVSDYFHSSLPTEDISPEANIEAKIQRLRDLDELRARTGKPIFITHPFRDVINRRLVTRPIEPWITALQPRPDGVFPEEVSDAFCGFEVRRLARACREYNFAIEINGGTDGRIRAINLPAVLQISGSVTASSRRKE